MSQAAYQVDDQDGASFLVTINEILSAIRTGNSGATEPNDTYPFMIWVDTNANAVKQRNSADDAWVTLYTLPGGQLAQLSGMALTGALNYKRATIAAAATTTPLWTAANGNVQDWTGTPTITDFPEAPQAGAKREVYPAAGTVITNAGSISVQGNGDRTSEAGEKWIVTAVTTTTFYVEVVKKDGTAVTGAFDASYFKKPSIQAHCFSKTGAGTISVLAGTEAAVNGTLISFGSDTAVVMPTLSAGTDYAIYICDDGTIRADASFTAPSGYTTTDSRQIGGFHYAPGGNANAQSGGNTTPAINEYSIWDIKFRPACVDPRGMALIAGSFWADIYLLGVDYLTNGSSKYNVTIADGSAPPKRSTLYGGNGTTTYADGNWWNMNEALKHCGKRSATYSEFAALAYGTTEATSSGGSDVPTTGVTGTGATSAWNLFTSKFGIIQATGCIWVWGDEFGGGNAGASWTANTQGRGSTYQMENAVRLGGAWHEGAFSGSRCSIWNVAATSSDASTGARGVCDHMTLV